MAEADRDRVEAIQHACYPACYHENVDMIMTRRATYPAGSFVTTDAAGDVVAYAQCYPWDRASALEKPPALHDEAALSAISAAAAAPREESLMFAHEVTVWAQGKGHGRALMNAITSHATEKGYPTVLLVAVLGNEGVWAHFGFRRHRELPVGYYAGADVHEAATSIDNELARGSALAAPRLVLAPQPSASSTDMTAAMMTMGIDAGSARPSTALPGAAGS